MTTAIANTSAKEAVTTNLKLIHASLETLKQGINYFYKETSDPEETAPITDASFTEDLAANLNDALSNLSQKHRDATKKSIKEFSNSISSSDKVNKNLVQTVWTKFLDFESTAKEFSPKCETKLAALKQKKLAPFHLLDLLPAIDNVQNELQTLIDCAEAIQ